MYQQQQQQQHLQWEPTMAFHWIGHSVPQITFSSLQSIANRKYPRYCTHWILQLLYHSFITNLKRETTTTQTGEIDEPTAENWSINVCFLFSECCSVGCSILPIFLYIQPRWNGFSHPEDGVFNKSRILWRRNRRHATSNGTHRRKKRAGGRRRSSDSLFYLIPLHGGIWHHCVDLQSK